MRKTQAFKIQDLQKFKDRLLLWSKQFEEVIWLDSNAHNMGYHSYEAVLAVEAEEKIVSGYENAFQELRNFQQRTKDWLFGYLSYDLKNGPEQLSSGNLDGVHFPDMCFFRPRRLILLKDGMAEFCYLNNKAIDGDFQHIMSQPVSALSEVTEGEVSPPRIKLRIFKDEYFRQIKRMLAHIHRGDIYEANFCQEFYAEDTRIDAYRTYQKLNRISTPPFAAFLQMDEKYLLCASPERYLRKQGDKVISQPIKGTARRSADPAEDEMLKQELQRNVKERAENIMIVDLVRNDLSKSALKGSVRVEEMCAVYTFKQLHQMISTVSALISKDKNPVEIIEETFPMGSMTGAPKVSAMKIIEDLEATKRGLYSGAVGYFSPEGDFDFNVVIRSILYNAKDSYVSYSVGSAITAKASPDKEYDECLLKAKAMREVLENF